MEIMENICVTNRLFFLCFNFGETVTASKNVVSCSFDMTVSEQTQQLEVKSSSSESDCKRGLAPREPFLFGFICFFLAIQQCGGFLFLIGGFLLLCGGFLFLILRFRVILLIFGHSAYIGALITQPT